MYGVVCSSVFGSVNEFRWNGFVRRNVFGSVDGLVAWVYMSKYIYV